MTKKLLFDPGHGDNDPGAIGNGIKEKDIVLKIAKYAKDILDKEYEGIEVRLTRSTDKFLTLQERVDISNAWRPDLFCSIHVNAHPDSSASGFESYVSRNASSSSVKYQDLIHPAINNRAKLRDRGQKTAGFTVITKTFDPAILTESGFISNASDASKLKSDSYLKSLARGHVEGIVKALGEITRKTPAKTEQPTNEDLFRIQVGAFSSRENAERFLQDVKKQYPDAYITE